MKNYKLIFLNNFSVYNDISFFAKTAKTLVFIHGATSSHAVNFSLSAVQKLFAARL